MRLEAEIYYIKGISQSRGKVASTKAGIYRRIYATISIVLFARVFTRSRNYSYLCVSFSQITYMCLHNSRANNDSSNVSRHADARQIVHSAVPNCKTVLLLWKNFLFHRCNSRTKVHSCVPFNIKVSCKWIPHFKRCLVFRDIAKLYRKYRCDSKMSWNKYAAWKILNFEVYLSLSLIIFMLI